jgi:nucleoside-diphosphate-sugar epimerase
MKRLLLTEESNLNPLSLYASTKMESERYLIDSDAVIFRLGTLHGISDNYSRIRMDLVINNFALKATIGEPLTIFGGTQWRPFLHVKDYLEIYDYVSLLKNQGKTWKQNSKNTARF